MFNTTSATVYAVDNPTPLPFEIDIVNQLTYNATGTKATGFKFKEATENGATIVGKSEYHLGSSEFGYYETTGAQQIAEW